VLSLFDHPILLHFLAGWAPAFALAVPAMILGRRWGWRSVPRPDRHGDKAVPLSGGLVLGLALTIPILLFNAHARFLPAAWGLAAVGIWDDLREMPPWMKGLLTAAVALAAPRLAGSAAGGAYILQAAALWLLLHAYNIIDNMDGIALGTAAVTFAGLAFLTGEPLPWACAGACGALLLWNLPPARIFLGDGGAFLIGYAVWFWSVQACARPVPDGRPLLPVVVAVGLPLVDLIFVSVTRSLRGSRPWIGGRDHLTHRLSRWCGSSRAALAIWIAVQAGLVGGALILAGD
jgi:UDP-GlcNAc:undecaprenyl-phosphate GlcNAc-1-phosphate transferase